MTDIHEVFEDNWAKIERKGAERRAKRTSSAQVSKTIPFWERDHVKEVMASLPKEKRETFRQFVDDYRKCAYFIHSNTFVSVKVLAEMAKLGWRKS